MADPKISLMIYGTRLSTGGWEPLILLNTPPFPQLANMGLAGLRENPVYYTFRIDREYTQFTLVYNSRYIKAYQAARDGALKVSISIPKGYRIQNATPYQVLEKLRNTLEDVALTPIMGRERVFEFKPTFPPEGVFAEVLNRYTLVPTEMPHRPMSSTSEEIGFIPADPVKMEQLFEDVQYPEFEPYKEIAVAPIGESEHVLKNLDIPRKPKYEIYANNTNITSQIKDTYNFGYSDEIVIDVLKFLKLSKAAYEDKYIEFTVQEVLDGKSSIPAQVDRQREIIKLNIESPRKRRRKLRIITEGVTKPDAIKYLKVLVNGYSRTLSGDTFELVGDELTNYKINVTVEGDKYKSTGAIRPEGDNIIVPLKEIEKPKKVQTLGGNPYRDSRVNREEAGNRNEVIKFKLVLCDKEAIENRKVPYPVRFEDNHGASFTKECFFDKTKEDNLETEIEIPLSWSGDYKVKLSTDCAKIDKKSQRFYTLRPKMSDIIIHEDQLSPMSWRERMPRSKRALLDNLIWFFIGVLLTAALVFAYVRFFSNPKAESTGTEENTEYVDVNAREEYPLAPPTSGDPVEAQVESLRQRLAQEGITFAEVKEMNNWLTENQSKLTGKGLNLKNSVEAYMSIITVLESANTRKVGDIQKVTKDNGNLIDSKHFDLLQKVWSKGKNSSGGEIPVKPEEEKKVNEALKSIIPTSFRDLPASADVLKPRETPSVSQTSTTSPSNKNTPEKKVSGKEKDKKDVKKEEERW